MFENKIKVDVKTKMGNVTNIQCSVSACLCINSLFVQIYPTMYITPLNRINKSQPQISLS